MTPVRRSRSCTSSEVSDGCKDHWSVQFVVIGPHKKSNKVAEDLKGEGMPEARNMNRDQDAIPESLQ